MVKFIVVVAFFALVAVALAAPQPEAEEKSVTDAKSGDLETASSLYGGFYGGYPYGAHGYSHFHRGYGGYGHGLGYGYGYPYGGYGYGFGY